MKRSNLIYYSKHMLIVNVKIVKLNVKVNLQYVGSYVPGITLKPGENYV